MTGLKLRSINGNIYYKYCQQNFSKCSKAIQKNDFFNNISETAYIAYVKI